MGNTGLGERNGIQDETRIETNIHSRIKQKIPTYLIKNPKDLFKDMFASV